MVTILREKIFNDWGSHLGISKQLREKWAQLSSVDCDRIVRMAWEDRTAFDNIQKQFGMSTNEIEKFMRTQLDEKSYKRWRKRANTQGHLKHEKKNPELITHFKARGQRPDGSTKK